MGLLMFIYALCATRTNIVYVAIFTSLILVFSLLAASYWKVGKGEIVVGNRLTVVSFDTFFISILCSSSDMMILGWWCCSIFCKYARILPAGCTTA